MGNNIWSRAHFPEEWMWCLSRYCSSLELPSAYLDGVLLPGWKGDSLDYQMPREMSRKGRGGGTGIDNLLAPCDEALAIRFLGI